MRRIVLEGPGAALLALADNRLRRAGTGDAGAARGSCCLVPASGLHQLSFSVLCSDCITVLHGPNFVQLQVSLCKSSHALTYHIFRNARLASNFGFRKYVWCRADLAGDA